MQTLDRDLFSIQEVRTLIAKAKKAQEVFKTFTQEQVDKVVRAMAEAAEKEAVRLAKMANEETGFGKWEDKVIKNTFASKHMYDTIKDLKTVGIINEDKENRSEEHTSELQSRQYLVCRLLLDKKKQRTLILHIPS